MIQYLALVAAPFLLSSATVTGSDVPVTCGKTNALEQLISRGFPAPPMNTRCAGRLKANGEHRIDEGGGAPRTTRSIAAGPNRCNVHCDCDGNRWCTNHNPNYARWNVNHTAGTPGYCRERGFFNP